MNSHECLVSRTVYEMSASGEWLVPLFNGKPRLKKPPLQYWLVGTISALNGKINEWSSRVPSFTAGLGIVLLTYLLGQWMFGSPHGFAAGVVQSFSVFMIKFSRLGTTDMSNAFFVMLAYVSAWAIFSGRSRKLLWKIAFWLALALGFLTKGPFSILITLIPISIYCAYLKRWTYLRELFDIRCVAVFFVAILPWFILVSLRIDDALNVWWRESFMRIEGEFTEPEPWYYYFQHVAAYWGPWVILLPWVVKRPFEKSWKENREAWSFVGMWLLLGIILLSFSAGKRPRYLVPVLLPGAFFFAYQINAAIEASKKNPKIGKLIGWAVIAFSLVGGTVGWLLNHREKWVPPNAGLAIPAISICISLIALPLIKNKIRSVLVLFLTFSLILICCAFRYAAPRFDNNRPVSDFSERVNEIVPRGEKIYMFDNVDSRVLFYSKKRIVPVKSLDAIKRKAERKSLVYLILKRGEFEHMKNMAGVSDLLQSQSPEWIKTKHGFDGTFVLVKIDHGGPIEIHE